MKITDIINAINNDKVRSAWDRGVNAYALELAEELQEAISGGYFNEANTQNRELLKKQLLNGAATWSQYSWGGSALICNSDIAERLCSPSEYKKSREGERKPNASEEWLDTQARALCQAAHKIIRLARA